MGARHAAGAEHADDLGVLVGHVFDADAAVAADPHVLQMAVVDEGERLAVLDRGEQDQAAEQARACVQYFSCVTHAVVFASRR